jgi:ABC-type lipoprotein export system ATPase subunit
MNSLIVLENLCKTFYTRGESVEALKNADIVFQKGLFYGILGHSGSGKSTLLHLIGGMDRPTSGILYMESQDLTQLSDRALSQFRNRKIGFIFQQYNLLPRLTVYKNMEMPVFYNEVKPPEIKEKIRSLLEFVGLESKLNRYPTELSGGEQQRVAIARALVNNPVILLADEPTGNLDETNARIIMELFQKLNQEKQITILMVTHNIELTRYCHQTLRMSNGSLFQI